MTVGYLAVLIEKQLCYLHRLAIVAVTGDQPNGQVDHINGNRLDNRWCNLRVCVANRQQWNMKKRKDGSSRFKGVTWNKEIQRWRANLRVNGKVIYGGVHTNEEAAARRYDDLARRYFGQFACVNFPREGEQSAHDRNLSASPRQIEQVGSD